MNWKRYTWVAITVATIAGQCGAIAAPDDTLLLRLRFAGTKALMADTNAAYLTNYSALPQAKEFGAQIVAKVSALPAQWLAGKDTNRDLTPIRPVMTEWLANGFTLELHGDGQSVADFAIAAKADADTAKRWATAWDKATSRWSLSGKIKTRQANGWFLVAGSKTEAGAALEGMEKNLNAKAPEGPAMLQAELSSKLIPAPIRETTYGGFDRLTLAITAEDQNLKVRGKATYAHDLPPLGAPPVVPTNLVTESTVSFTMVREPGHWLDKDSVLRRFLPEPVPDVIWFWGGEGSPYQFFSAVPYKSREAFNTELGPKLVAGAQPIANFIGTGNVVLDTNQATIAWKGTPFVLPRAYAKDSGTNHFAMLETFPQGDFPPGLTPALIERVSNRTNLVAFDWEYVTLRFDTWFRIGQLAMLCGNYEQILSKTPSIYLIQKLQLHTTNSGNTTTEVLQTGPRELTINARGPFAINSFEMFWLANWLESPNFPDANFLVPMAQ